MNCSMYVQLNHTNTIKPANNSYLFLSKRPDGRESRKRSGILSVKEVYTNVTSAITTAPAEEKGKCYTEPKLYDVSSGTRSSKCSSMSSPQLSCEDWADQSTKSCKSDYAIGTLCNSRC